MKQFMTFMLIAISMNLGASQKDIDFKKSNNHDTYVKRTWKLNQLLDMNGFDEDELLRFEMSYQSACPERLSFPVNIRLEHHDDYYMPALTKEELMSLINSSSHEKSPTIPLFMSSHAENDKKKDVLRSLRLLLEASTKKYQEPVYELTELGKYLVNQILVDVASCNNHAILEEEID